MESFYKLAFQTLSNFHSLGLISEQEKSYLKEEFLNFSTPQLNISQDQMSVLILQKIEFQRQQIQKTHQRSESMYLIEEETDEDENI